MQGFIAIMFSGIFVFVVGLIGVMRCTYERIYPDGNTQALITTCQVDDRISKMLPSMPGGYFHNDGVKTDCTIMDNTLTDKVKVRYKFPIFSRTLGYDVLWIDRKDYVPYLNLKMLNQKINDIKINKKSKKG